MSTQDGIRLAVHIIDTHFGHLVSKVCECLLSKESATFNQIVNHTGLLRQDVKKCLLVLIQHNCIQPFNLEQRGGFDEGNSVSIQYTLVFSNILHRLRFSKFLRLVTEKLDKECARVLQGLLEHGRLTLEQVIKRAESSQNEASYDAHKAFKGLVNARFVERCPDSDPSIDLPTDEETASKSRRSKFSKVLPQTTEQRAISDAIPLEAKRFLISYDFASDDTTPTEKDGQSILSSGEKRKRDFSEIDDELGSSSFQKEVLWRPNFEEFVRCLRLKACIVHEKFRLDEGAAVVLGAMLEGPRNAENTNMSAPLALDAIYKEVGKSETVSIPTVEHVRLYLDELECRKDADDLYSVDSSRIIEYCRDEEIESFVLKRYGGIAHMIFRSLSKESRFCETEQISNVILRKKDETLKTLLQLWKDNLLFMEVKNVSTPATRPMQFFLWKLNKDVAREQVLDLMYYAAMNLMNRASFEFSKEPELMELIQLPNSKLTGMLAAKKTRLSKIKSCLEASLMKLDDAIMLFHDF